MSTIALLHCSDLHIGSEPANSKFKNMPLIRRSNVHDLLLARGLTEVVDDVAQQCGLSDEEVPYIVMSGDLTAHGHAKEFLVAHSFLRSFWRQQRSPETKVVGFNIRDSVSGLVSCLAVVPGNHDQWRGKSYMNAVGYTRSLRGKHFRATPWKRTWQRGELLLELYGLDSNAGLSTSSGSWNQKGSFDLSQNGEFEQLENDLRKNSPLPAGVKYRVRALVFHHCLTELDQPSVDKLLEAAEDFSIAAMLTGHIHDFYKKDNDTLPKKVSKVWELRSASTLQGPANRLKPAPGFLVHKIFVDGSQVRWQAWRYVWVVSTQGFAVYQQQNPFVDFNVP